jgi:hypothetical protein
MKKIKLLQILLFAILGTVAICEFTLPVKYECIEHLVVFLVTLAAIRITLELNEPVDDSKDVPWKSDNLEEMIKDAVDKKIIRHVPTPKVSMPEDYLQAKKMYKAHFRDDLAATPMADCPTPLADTPNISTAERIKSMLQSNGKVDSKKIVEMMKRAGYKSVNVRSALHFLLKKGVIKRNKHKEYSMVEKKHE